MPKMESKPIEKYPSFKKGILFKLYY